jgi:hypothetical protein
MLTGIIVAGSSHEAWGGTLKRLRIRIPVQVQGDEKDED